MIRKSLLDYNSLTIRSTRRSRTRLFLRGKLAEISMRYTPRTVPRVKFPPNRLKVLCMIRRFHYFFLNPCLQRKIKVQRKIRAQLTT